MSDNPRPDGNPFISRETLTRWRADLERYFPTVYEQEMADALRRNAAEWQARVLGGLMGVPLWDAPLNTLAIPGALTGSTTGPAKATQALSVDDLNRTIENLNRLFDRSPLRAIWFVKCPPADERAFLDRLTRGLAVTGAPPVNELFYGYLGVPIYYFDENRTNEEIEVEVRAGRWFVVMPGIWLEMGDGRHKKVSLT